MIRRIALAAGSIAVMTLSGSPCAMAQSGDGHTHDAIAAHDHAADGQELKAETSLSEADWLKQAGDVHGDDHGDDDAQHDHGDAGHGDHDGHDEVAAAQLDDAGPDEGARPVLSEEDWMKAPVDDHHGGDDHHDGNGEHKHN